MEEEPQVSSEGLQTEHEPHEHAQKRITMALVAILCVLGLGFLWSQWGEEIKQACTGGDEEGACAIDLPDAPAPPIGNE